MHFILSNDGTTPGQRLHHLPGKAWVQDTDEAGHYEPLTEQNMNDHGIYAFTETDQPDADHGRSVERVGAGFETVWTFDAALAESNVMFAAADAERQAIQSMVSDLTDIVEADTLTEAEQTEALKKLARICRLAVDMV